jgi:hypothetical protein
MFFTHLGGEAETRALHKVASIRLARVVVPALVVIGIFGVVDTIRAATNSHSPLLEQMNLDGELNVPSFWSGGLLLAAALVATGVARLNDALRVPWAMLAVLFAFMAGDEIVQLHERVAYHTGVNWQLIYLPLMLAAAVAWASVVRRDRSSRLGLLLGAAGWLVAQILELLWYYGKLPLRVEATPEEIAEMLGSLAFVTAGVSALQALGAPAITSPGARPVPGRGSARRRTRGRRPPAARWPGG